MELEQGTQSVGPLRARFPQKRDLHAIIAVEDRFQKRMRALLTGLHHEQARSLRFLATLFGIHLEELRLWFRWYGIQFGQHAFVEYGRSNVFGRNLSVEATAALIVGTYRRIASWNLTARALGTSVSELQSWVTEHLDELKQLPVVDAVRLLLSISQDEHLRPHQPASNGDASSLPSTARPDVVKHPCGLQFLQDVQDAIDAFCTKHDCTEEELFTALYDPLRLNEMGEAIGIAPGICSELVRYYNKGTFRKLVFKHESGLVLPVEFREALQRRCKKLSCTVPDVFIDHADEERADAVASELRITKDQYLALVHYYKTICVIEPFGGQQSLA